MFYGPNFALSLSMNIMIFEFRLPFMVSARVLVLGRRAVALDLRLAPLSSDPKGGLRALGLATHTLD